MFLWLLSHYFADVHLFENWNTFGDANLYVEFKCNFFTTSTVKTTSFKQCLLFWCTMPLWCEKSDLQKRCLQGEWGSCLAQGAGDDLPALMNMIDAPQRSAVAAPQCLCLSRPVYMQYSQPELSYTSSSFILAWNIEVKRKNAHSEPVVCCALNDHIPFPSIYIIALTVPATAFRFFLSHRWPVTLKFHGFGCLETQSRGLPLAPCVARFILWKWHYDTWNYSFCWMIHLPSLEVWFSFICCLRIEWKTGSLVIDHATCCKDHLTCFLSN